MMHDNYDLNELLTISREYPNRDGLYFIYLDRTHRNIAYPANGLMYYFNKQWLSYPSKYTVNDSFIDSAFVGCIGPIPEYY